MRRVWGCQGVSHSTALLPCSTVPGTGEEKLRHSRLQGLLQSEGLCCCVRAGDGSTWPGRGWDQSKANPPIHAPSPRVPRAPVSALPTPPSCMARPQPPTNSPHPVPPPHLARCLPPPARCTAASPLHAMQPRAAASPNRVSELPAAGDGAGRRRPAISNFLPHTPMGACCCATPSASPPPLGPPRRPHVTQGEDGAIHGSVTTGDRCSCRARWLCVSEEAHSKGPRRFSGGFAFFLRLCCGRTGCYNMRAPQVQLRERRAGSGHLKPLMA